MNTTPLVILSSLFLSLNQGQDNLSNKDLLIGQWRLRKHTELVDGKNKKIPTRKFYRAYNFYANGEFSLFATRKENKEVWTAVILGKWKLNAENNKVLFYDLAALPHNSYNGEAPKDRTVDIIRISDSELVLHDSIGDWQSRYKRFR